MTSERAAALLALADKVEAASGPDRELMCAAYRAVFPEVSAGTWDAIDDWDARYDRFCAMLDVSAYIDAAATLVPEGWDYGVQCLGEDGSTASVWRHGWHDDTVIMCHTQEPAPALVSAALRAHAAQMGGV